MRSTLVGVVSVKRKPEKTREPTARQQAVLTFLETHPGATIQAVADKLEVSHTAACSLLRLLERDGFVESVRHGRSVRHYRQGTSAGGDRLAPILRDQERLRVLRGLQSPGSGGASINRLALRLGLTFGIVKSTLEELANLGFVSLEHVNGRYRVQLTAKLNSLVLATPEAEGEVAADTGFPAPQDVVVGLRPATGPLEPAR